MHVVGCNDDAQAMHFMDDEGGELCDNVTYLGKSGLFTSTSGLSVAYISGLDGGSKDDFSHFSESDVDSLKQKVRSAPNFAGIDILLTSPWPKGVSAYGTELKHSLNNESDSIAQLTLALRPRYHFSGVEGVSYERNPYRNHTVLSGQSSHVSRFVALADVGNKEKRKYLYAFNIVPMKYLDKDELHKQPADTTECPYKLKVDSRSLAQQAPERNAFFYGEAPMSGQKRRGRSIDCTYTDYSNSNVHM
mgnify:CR=1 FL=1